MKNYYIITNTDKDEGLVLTGRIAEYLQGRGCRCDI